MCNHAFINGYLLNYQIERLKKIVYSQFVSKYSLDIVKYCI